MVIENLRVYGLEEAIRGSKYPMSVNLEALNTEITPTVRTLFSSQGCSGHDQALTGIVAQFDLTLTVKAWTEAERYHFLDFVSSQSTMHRIGKFDLDNQYIEYVDPRMVKIMNELKEKYNQSGEKEDYLRLLYSNPCGFKLTAAMTTNYRQLKTIYKQRKSHRLPEWREFCRQLEEFPYFSELVLGRTEKYEVKNEQN